MNARSPDGIPPLPDGDFPERLGAAIAARGLGLERLSDRLRDRDVSVSASTLSLWRNGRTRPYREKSLKALRALEFILETPSGYLTEATVAVEKGSDSWWSSIPMTPQVLDYSDEFLRALEEFDMVGRAELRNAMMHSLAEFNEHGAFINVRNTHLFQANLGGAERFVQSSFPDPKGDRTPHMITLVTGGRIGRRRTFEASGQVVFEIILDEPLERGQYAVVEYTIQPRNPAPVAQSSPRYEVRTSNAIGQLSVELRFHPDRPPVNPTSMVRNHLFDPGKQSETVRPLTLADHQVVVSESFFDRGGIRMDWEW